MTYTISRSTTFTVEAPNNSDTNLYVQSAKLNGRPLRRAWITHEEVIAGGRLTLKLGSHANKHWGSALNDQLPSSVRPVRPAHNGR